jgi:hypothetical protein
MRKRGGEEEAQGVESGGAERNALEALCWY